MYGKPFHDITPSHYKMGNTKRNMISFLSLSDTIRLLYHRPQILRQSVNIPQLHRVLHWEGLKSTNAKVITDKQNNKICLTFDTDLENDMGLCSELGATDENMKSCKHHFLSANYRNNMTTLWKILIDYTLHFGCSTWSWPRSANQNVTKIWRISSPFWLELG